MNRNAPFVLSATCLVALALLALVWFHLGTEALPRSVPSARTVLASAPTEGTPSAPAESEASPDGPREARVPGTGEAPPAPGTASAAPATVIGSLRIDGEPQERGEVELRDAAGSWTCTQTLNYDGKFRFDDVPSGNLAFSFELSPGAPRRLLVARIDVAAAPGEVAGLDLELETTEINVRVLGSGPGWSQARVEIEGPGLSASVETDENGKCALGLIGKGRFTFTATTRDGKCGQVSVELEGGKGLESIVIPTQDVDG